MLSPAGSTKYLSQDVFYKFRSSSNFRYMAGHTEADSVFILRKLSPSSFQTSIILPSRSAHSELWEGPRPTVSRIAKEYEISEGFELHQTGSYLKELLNSVESIYVDGEAFLDGKLLQPLVDSLQAKPLRSVQSILHSIRVLKSQREINYMRKAAEFAAEGFKSVRPSELRRTFLKSRQQAVLATRPGISEQVLEIEMEYASRKQGANGLSFVPVVAGVLRSWNPS